MYVGGSAGVLMMFLWRSLGVGMGVLGWDWVCVWGCGWVSEFWTNSKVYTHYKHEYGVLNSIWPKSGLSEFWKNTLQIYFETVRFYG